MPPKGQGSGKPSTRKAGSRAKAGPKAKPGPQPSACKPIADAVDTQHAAAGADASSAGAPLKKQRKLKESKTDEKVDELFSTKFQDYEEEQLDTLVGKTTGKTAREFLADHVREKRGDGRYFAANFWTTFYAEFDIGSNRFADMVSSDDAPGNEDIADEILEALLPLNEKNPSARTPVPFVNYLEYAPKPNITELKFMLEACRQGPKIVRSTAEKMAYAMLKFIGRHKLNVAFPAFWEKVRGDFDSVVKGSLTKNVLSGSARREYVVGHRLALGTLHNFDDLMAVEDAVEAEQAIPDKALRSILSTQCGKALYKAEGAKLEYQSFIDTVGKYIKDMDEEHFKEDDVIDLDRVMLGHSRRMTKELRTFVKKKSTVSIFETKVTVLINSINDEWHFRLHARIRSLAVNTGGVPRTAWEVLLWGDAGLIEGLPQTLKVPENMLFDIKNVRRAVAKILSGYSFLTFAEMKDLIGAHEDELIGIDRFFAIEVAFLKDHAEAIAQKMVRDKALLAFPDSKNFRAFSFDKTLEELTKLSDHKLTLACHVSLGKELAAVVALVKSVKDALPPKDEQIALMSPFFKGILKRCEFFLTTSVTKKGSGHGLPVTVLLAGAEAMQVLWDEFSAQEDKSMNSALPFRRFAWMLGSEQRASVDAYVQSEVRAIQGMPAFGAKSLCDAGAADSAASAAGGPGSASAAVVPALLGAASVGCASVDQAAAKERAASDAKAKAKADLLAMFKK